MLKTLSSLLLCAILLTPIGVRAAIFTVTSSADSGPGTLREAVAASNTTTGQDTVNFNISNPVTLSSAINITDAVVIDGQGTTIQGGGLVLQSGQNTLQGLAIVNCGIGIEMLSGNNKVQGCTIGTDWNDNTGLGNTLGIRIEGYGNLVGGNRNIGRGNIISSNQHGIRIESGGGNSICGNVIGLTSDQSSTMNGGSRGVWLLNTQANMIGLPLEGWGNIIGGNILAAGPDQDPAGIYLEESNYNRIQNNLIGLNESDESMSNSIGIYLSSNNNNNIIGGYQNAVFRERNIISGNQEAGITIVISGYNSICGNYIGVDSSGNNAVGNKYGIDSNGLPIIGGENVDSGHILGNVISGNLLTGIRMTGSGNILGNIIGLNVAGDLAVPNKIGIEIIRSYGASVGWHTQQGRNTISGNNEFGVRIEGGQYINISENYIGISQDGLTVIRNGLAQIYIYFLNFNYFDAIYSCSVMSNLICGGPVGIKINAGRLENYFSFISISRNSIGVLSDGTVASPQIDNGIDIATGEDVDIGDRYQDSGNLIAGCVNGINVAGGPVGIEGNTICAFSGKGILLQPGANNDKPAPLISIADVGLVSGTAQAGDNIEVFKAEPGSGQGGSLILVGRTVADGAGVWQLIPSGLVGGDYACVTATRNNRTSEFSLNKLVTELIPTPTPTFTPTVTPTFTPTSTKTPSSTISPTATVSPTWTASQTMTRTQTASFTPTATPTVTVTYSVTPGATPTPTPTITATHSPTQTATASPTVVLSITSTITPTATETATALPTASPTEVLPTASPTEVLPTATASATATPTPYVASGQVLAFPNPARGEVHFAYTLNGSGSVVIDIYNLLGERVAHITESKSGSAGQTVKTTWNAADVAPGVYLARIVVKDGQGRVRVEEKIKVGVVR